MKTCNRYRTCFRQQSLTSHLKKLCFVDGEPSLKRPCQLSTWSTSQQRSTFRLLENDNLHPSSLSMPTWRCYEMRESLATMWAARATRSSPKKHVDTWSLSLKLLILRKNTNKRHFTWLQVWVIDTYRSLPSIICKLLAWSRWRSARLWWQRN